MKFQKHHKGAATISLTGSDMMRLLAGHYLQTEFDGFRIVVEISRLDHTETSKEKDAE